MISRSTLIIGVLLSQLVINISQAQTQAQNNNSPPLNPEEIKLFQDWSTFSFSSFEPVQQGGEIGTEYNELVGWDISRQWQAGDEIEDILKLGDLENSLSPQLFSLEDIYQRVNQKNGVVATDTDGDGVVNNVPSTLTLADYPLATNQTVESLTEAVPELLDYEVGEVAPIRDLLEENGYDTDTDIGTLIEDEDIAELGLDSIDLGSYSVDSVPNLGGSQIEDMEGYEEMLVSEIPGLSELALSEYPNPINARISFVGRIDFVWGEAETNKNSTISGSTVEGFQVPCQQNCAHLELDDVENLGRAIALPFEGDQWIQGRNLEHWVAGGTGCFTGGREPTGIHPFGNTFKAVLWDTQESTDTAQIVSFFNIKTQCGESPYFIGPFPYPQGFVSVNDWLFLGSGL